MDVDVWVVNEWKVLGKVNFIILFLSTLFVRRRVRHSYRWWPIADVLVVSDHREKG